MEKERISNWKIYIWCLSFLKRYAVFVAIYFIFVAIQQACYVVVPKIIQRGIDDVFGNGNIGLMKTLAVYMLITIAVIIVSRVIYALCLMVFCEKGMKVIQYAVIDKARELGFDYFEKTPRGEFLSETYSNILSIYFLYLDFFPNSVQHFFKLAFASVMICLSKNVLFISILVFCYIGELIVTILSRKGIEKQDEECQVNRNAYYKNVYDCIDLQEELHGYQASDWVKKRLQGFMNKCMLSMGSGLWKEKIVENIMNVFLVISITSYFILGVIKSNISIGNVVAYYSFIIMALSAFSALCNTIIRQKRNLADARKPYEFMQLEPNVKEKENPVVQKITGNIVFDNISFHYKNKEDVLHNFSLTIKEGEKVVVVGESGCGKTTLFKLLLRFYDLSAGRILLNGISIADYAFASIRESIGIVFQDAFLFSESVMENIKFGKPDATREEVVEASELACADEFIRNLPEKYETPLGVRGNTISGGEKQRLSIARAMLKKPDIYLFDESTSSLDSILEKKVMDHIFKATEGKTVCMISHRISVIKEFPRIVVMKEGKVVEDGSFEELYRSGTYFFELLSRGLILSEK